MADIARTLKPGERITVRAPSPTGKYTSLPLVEVKAGDRAIVSQAGTTPTPTPTPTPTSFYGTIGMDTKGNLEIGRGDGTVAHRFRAGTSSELESVRWCQRWGPGGYSGGTGGTIKISVHNDGPNSLPGPEIDSVTYVPGDRPGGDSNFLAHSFPVRPRLVKGALYWITWRNIHAQPTENWMSINDAVHWEDQTPRQPMFSDTDSAVYSERGGPMHLEPKYTAIMDLTYADGTHDGQGYIESMRGMQAKVSGTETVRQRFTVSGADRVVSECGIRIIRTAGSDPLVVRLENGDGSLLESFTIPAASIPLDGGAVIGAPTGRWIANPLGTRTLIKGQTYNLRLTCAASSSYNVIPVREGWDSGDLGGTGNPTGFRSQQFRDGGVEKSSGGSWSALYPWSPVDLMFYLR